MFGYLNIQLELRKTPYFKSMAVTTLGTLKVTKIQSMFSPLFYEQRRELRFSHGQLMMTEIEITP